MILRNKWTLVATLALAAVVAGCGGGGDKAASGGKVAGDAAKGKVAYENSCISCHGADAKGMPGLGKSLVTKSDWMKKQNDEALVAFIKQGRPASDPENTTKVDMPPKGGNPALTDDDIVNLVAFLRSIQK